jgi:hypothetical protein
LTPREERLARNETLFRGVNEKVKEVRGEFEEREAGDLIEFICECGREGCVEQVPLTVAEYEAVRARPTRFLLKPGHWQSEVERVVEQNERFAVVEKHEEEAEIARETDPRR